MGRKYIFYVKKAESQSIPTYYVTIRCLPAKENFSEKGFELQETNFALA